VVAKVRERQEVSKEATHRVHMERLNPKKLNGVEGKQQYRVEISNTFSNSVIIICTVTTCKWSINLFTNPNAVYSH
jgi:hypothetical protein